MVGRGSAAHPRQAESGPRLLASTSAPWLTSSTRHQHNSGPDFSRPPDVGEMKMIPQSLHDVGGTTYTYLLADGRGQQHRTNLFRPDAPPALRPSAMAISSAFETKDDGDRRRTTRPASQRQAGIACGRDLTADPSNQAAAARLALSPGSAGTAAYAAAPGAGREGTTPRATPITADRRRTTWAAWTGAMGMARRRDPPADGPFSIEPDMDSMDHSFGNGRHGHEQHGYIR